jgi:hypothetical protein
MWSVTLVVQNQLRCLEKGALPRLDRRILNERALRACSCQGEHGQGFTDSGVDILRYHVGA